MRIIAAVLFVLCLSFAGRAHACVCEDRRESIEVLVGSWYAESEVVAVFEVIEFKNTTETFAHGTEKGRWAVLEARHIFKGSGEPLLAHRPNRLFKSDCDVDFKKGNLLLVYGSSREPVSISRCSGSGLLMSRFTHIPVLFKLSGGTPEATAHGI